jgi:hypothetical protein
MIDLTEKAIEKPKVYVQCLHFGIDPDAARREASTADPGRLSREDE